MKRILSDQELIAQAYKHLGDIYKSDCDYRRGLKALKKALVIYKKLNNKIEISHTYNNIGNIHWVGSEMDKALEVYDKALKIQEELNLLKDVASTLSNIGGCLYTKGQPEEAISHYKRSIDIKKKINDLPELARTYNNLGAVYHQQGNIPEALKYLYDSLKINRQIDSRLEVTNNIANIAECEESLGHYQQALALSKEGLQLAQEISNMQFEAFSRLLEARIALNTGKYSEAEQILVLTEKLSEQITDQYLEYVICREKSQLYLELNQPDLFWEIAGRMHEIADCLDDKVNLVTTKIMYSIAYSKFNKQSDKALEYLNQAFDLNECDDTSTTSCRLYLQEFAISVDDPDFPEEKIRFIQDRLSKPANQILNPEFHYYYAYKLYKQNSFDSALKILFEGSTQAEKYSNINLLWKIKYLRGVVEREMYNYEGAYLNFRQAVTILKSQGQSIKNKDYLQSFLQQPEVTNLMQDIKELAQRMGQK
jgi:tetratricopeptide (TPR) repeat protein